MTVLASFQFSVDPKNDLGNLAINNGQQGQLQRLAAKINQAIEVEASPSQSTRLATWLDQYRNILAINLQSDRQKQVNVLQSLNDAIKEWNQHQAAMPRIESLAETGLTTIARDGGEATGVNFTDGLAFQQELDVTETISTHTLAKSILPQFKYLDTMGLGLYARTETGGNFVSHSNIANLDGSELSIKISNPKTFLAFMRKFGEYSELDPKQNERSTIEQLKASLDDPTETKPVTTREILEGIITGEFTTLMKELESFRDQGLRGVKNQVAQHPLWQARSKLEQIDAAYTNKGSDFSSLLRPTGNFSHGFKSQELQDAIKGNYIIELLTLVNLGVYASSPLNSLSGVLEISNADHSKTSIDLINETLSSLEGNPKASSFYQECLTRFIEIRPDLKAAITRTLEQASDRIDRLQDDGNQSSELREARTEFRAALNLQSSLKCLETRLSQARD